MSLHTIEYNHIPTTNDSSNTRSSGGSKGGELAPPPRGNPGSTTEKAFL